MLHAGAQGVLMSVCPAQNYLELFKLFVYCPTTKCNFGTPCTKSSSLGYPICYISIQVNAGF